MLIDDLSRHRIDHLDGLAHSPSFRPGQSQIHRFADSPRMQQASLDGVEIHDIDKTLDTFEKLYRGEPLES
ncbi:hypothetical protein GCM10010462_09220 [Microbacterium dextranolyticum]|uniref:Uncharacterized protein n=1 Tax=Microbacterium dextranolyticum TaxID=36806 RepID=A0A9W6HP44_9MICO|nr:hypothetical protein GCM10017591_23890 [Microbacterium dextranolyticum]